MCTGFAVLCTRTLTYSLHYKCVANHVICLCMCMCLSAYTSMAMKSFVSERYCAAHSNYSMRHTITRFQLNRHCLTACLLSSSIRIFICIYYTLYSQCVRTYVHIHRYERFESSAFIAKRVKSHFGFSQLHFATISMSMPVAVTV